MALKPSKPGVIITIAREHGSSGKQIGKLVAQKLGIPFYYKEMVALALSAGAEAATPETAGSLTPLMPMFDTADTGIAEYSGDIVQEDAATYDASYNANEDVAANERDVYNYLTGTMVCFFIGRFTGTWLIRRFAPHNVLAIYAFIAMLLCLLSAFSGGHVGLLALTLCSAFMSIQYPTIFSLGIKHLGQDTKYGSSFIVMTIIGGGIVTPVMGFVSDAAGNIPTAELVPALCFAIIFIFARFRSQAATN